jgi:hypothetical protein
MGTQTALYALETVGEFHEEGSYAVRRYSKQRLYGFGERWSKSRADLLFASEVLRCLRGGSRPSMRVLEGSGFVEHWMIVANDDVCLLTGTVWRLPFSRNMLATPLLAIDPDAGWARVFGEWLTIGAPRLDWVAAGIYPEGVADRAARWLERQLGAEDCDKDCLRQD